MPNSETSDVQVGRAKTRSDDIPTAVTPATAAQKVSIELLHALILAAPWVKCNGQFGEMVTAKNIAFKKFSDKFPEFFLRCCATVTDISPLLLFKEYYDFEEMPVFPTELNEFLYDMLSEVCNGNSYNEVSVYLRPDDGKAIRKDGRRAWFALLRLHAPISIGESKEITAQLNDFQFATATADICDSKIKFRELLKKLAEARGTPLTKLEKWNFLRNSIRSDYFGIFRVSITFQPEAKQLNLEWLMSAITELVRDQGNIVIPTGRLSGLTPEMDAIGKLTEQVKQLAMITTRDQSNPRVNKSTKPADKDTKLNYVKKDPPCKHCPGENHWFKHCPKLADAQLKLTSGGGANVKSLNATTSDGVASLPSSNGFLCGLQRKSTAPEYIPQGSDSDDTPLDSDTNSDSDGCSPLDFGPIYPSFASEVPEKSEPVFPKHVHQTKSKPNLASSVSTAVVCSPMFWLMHSIGHNGLVLRSIITFCVLITLAACWTSPIIHTINNLSGCTAHTAVTNYEPVQYLPEPPTFMVDSGASEHICCSAEYFQTLDRSKTQLFNVVHGSAVCSQGMGTVELAAMTTSNTWTTITLENVHYMPNQPMSLISVSQAIDTAHASNPDFKNKKWKFNTDLLRMTFSNGTYYLNAHAAPSPSF